MKIAGNPTWWQKIIVRISEGLGYHCQIQTSNGVFGIKFIKKEK